MGIVVTIQRYSLGDGPGIRTTVFLKGCPLKCLWCSNPETQDPQPEVGHRESLCRHCGKCLAVCPESALFIRDGQIRMDRSKCSRCGACVKGCVYEAMIWYGEEMSVDEVVRAVRQDEMFYGTRGGVTLSGGEVLMQAEFAAAILEKCQEAGIHTAIETSGCGSKLGLLLPWLDMVMFDLKTASPALHKELTGVDNGIIAQNLRMAAQSGVELLVRYPMIPGYNDGEAERRGIAELMKSCGLSRIEIMPYHSFGVTKYNALGRDYGVESESPDEERLNGTVALFKEYGIDCAVGGHAAVKPSPPDTREPRCGAAMLQKEWEE